MAQNLFTHTRTDAQRAAIRTLAGKQAHLRAMAGSDFSWRDENDDVIGGAQAGHSEKYGNARNGYRVIVWERQKGTCWDFSTFGECERGCNGRTTGVCATCGGCMALGEFDVAHYVGNGGSKGKNGGYVNLNVMGAHPWCNILDAEKHGEIVSPSALAHPEFLLHASPTRRECLEADARSLAEKSRTMAAYRVAHMARIAELLAQD